MKTAIIISGGMRTFDTCFPNFEWMVARYFPERRYFLSTYRDGDEWKAGILQAKYPDAVVEVVDAQPQIPVPPGCPPENTYKRGTPFMHEACPISVPPQAVMRQLWQNWQAYALFCRDGYEADIVVRARPDSWYYSFDPPDLNSFALKFGKVAHTPWFGRFSGVNDRFAILSRSAAIDYYGTFDAMPWLIADGCPLHPESLVKASLERGGCAINSLLRTEFGTKKADSFREPEISATDIAYLAAG